MQYNKISDSNNARDSVELASLVSSEEREDDIRSISSRGLSDDSPPVFNDDVEDDNRYRHARSFSVSTIGEPMFDLSASRDATNNRVPLEKQKRLSLLHGLSLVIGLMIGSGVFASPGQINSHAGSIGGSIVIWVISGLLAWTGASSYAELGSAIPLNGSSQAYLKYIFGPFTSFLFSWTALTVLKPGGNAIIAIIFSEYFTQAFGSEIMSNFWVQKIVALVGLGAITGLNCYSTRLGANASNVFMLIKVGLLIAIGVIGMVALPHFKDENALTGSSLFEGSGNVDFGDYAVALYAGLWAYDGWDNMNYVSAEMKNTRRDLPRVIHIAMPVVIFAYVLANISYFAVLSKEEIAGTNTVAIKFATKVFGNVGGVAFALCIAFSCVGAINATVFSSARLVYSSAEEGFLPDMFCQVHQGRGTPVNALLLQAAMTSFFVMVGEFHNLLTFYGIAAYLFYFLTVFGVVILRFKERELERPYKTWISTPVMFCCVALFLISRGIFEKPLEALFAVLFIAAGVPIYMWKFETNIWQLFKRGS